MKKTFHSFTCLLLLTLFTNTGLASSLDWQQLGELDGLVAYMTRTPSGTIRLKFENLNPYPIHARVDEVIIWCNGSSAGEGERQQLGVGDVYLDAGEAYASMGWNHYSCQREPYYIEINQVSVRRR